MQTPPPVANLLQQLRTMATNVGHLREDSDFSWHWRPSPEDWSLTEVICHLRDVEGEVHQSRFRDVMANENVFLTGVSADEWAISRRYNEQDGQAALTKYLRHRQKTVDMLSDLAPDIWQRQGIHAFFGRTSLQELVFLATRHDEIHWEQIKALLANQRSDELRIGG